MAWLTRQLQRQNPHSLYLALAALLFALTLIVDLFVYYGRIDPMLAWTLLVVCLTGSAAAIGFGRRVPRWIGIVAVLIFIAAQSYFLGRADDPQAVVSSIQQFPVMAFYLGWFVRPQLAIPLVALSLMVLGAVMAGNPQLAPEGEIGVPVAVQGLLSVLFGYSVGFYLWRLQLRSAETDPLTGVYNRTGFAERLDARLRRLAPQRGRLCLVAIDFDDFKLINDTRGHAAGDAALVETVGAWKRETRAGDVIGRLGGDEFALLLPGVDAEGALAVVQRLRECSTCDWSWGLAEGRPGDGAAELFERADRALYAQKHLRRGEVHG
ncbi:GGDEF domain-containing protein [Leucobacter sp. wl10]|uniref:GGDEF domain-containing protein n=1 Tax=Leucobacter sp. wl10 TaxID=2304677 RepID=UPI000E5A10D6|nr:GGDEF domain-containing protein [Leucobacter sp. wl10]RGE24296.1 GGDEF domain-containing protein [Leucobacter sp. wl10]